MDNPYRWLTFAVFAVIIAFTMYVTYLAVLHVTAATEVYSTMYTLSLRHALPI